MLRPMDTAPRDGAFFLMYRKDLQPIVVNWPEGYSRGIWHWYQGINCWRGQGHPIDGIGWMPLPEPPCAE